MNLLVKILIFYQKICNFKRPKSILSSANFCRFFAIFWPKKRQTAKKTGKTGKQQTRPPLLTAIQITSGTLMETDFETDWDRWQMRQTLKKDRVRFSKVLAFFKGINPRKGIYTRKEIYWFIPFIGLIHIHKFTAPLRSLYEPTLGSVHFAKALGSGRQTSARMKRWKSAKDWKYNLFFEFEMKMIL